ncbi:vancomycin resistance protein YoaR [Natranaerovirga pectinivora]|uniref:Vancomycin resistance protein YoaR n=1 Tax=Natranaerovirga pectinivora TaxID=682400 RepID=A0A4R3MIG0_9FIRM|nr:VanW family protein [Natranaerovirga pectinivora]TCT12173.1 vancomycin resistance protein YoaR [Natranaerovirga pectinivora]
MDKSISNKKIKKIILITLAIILSAILLSFVVGYTYIKKAINNDIIYEGIFINDVHVGGLTKEEAYEVIDEIVNNIKSNTLTIYYEDRINETVTFEELGFDAINKNIVDEAFSIGKEGNILKRFREIKILEEEHKYYELIFDYDTNTIISIIDSIKNNFSIKPKNAIIQRINKEFVIDEETIGYEVNDTATQENIFNLLMKFDEDIKVELVVEQIMPEYTKAYYGNIKNVIGSYVTNFNANNTQRTTNLIVGAKKIDGTLLHPNEVFSTNEKLSPVNIQNGYQPAPIIVNGRLEDGVGGGICQVATTLYNAVLFSEIDILERRNHSMPVAYVDLGKDAVLLSSVLDLKFKNSTEYPIYIESYIEGSSLYVKIYGLEERPANRYLEFESVTIGEVSPPPANIIYDDTMLEGVRKVEQKEVVGYTVKLYKHIYIDNVWKEKVLVNNSNYRATPATIRVGTKSPNNNSSVVATPSVPTNTTEINEEKEIEFMEDVEVINTDEIETVTNETQQNGDSIVNTEEASEENTED